MSHVSHMNESSVSCAWVMSHTCAYQIRSHHIWDYYTCHAHTCVYIYSVHIYIYTHTIRLDHITSETTTHVTHICAYIYILHIYVYTHTLSDQVMSHLRLLHIYAYQNRSSETTLLVDIFTSDFFFPHRIFLHSDDLFWYAHVCNYCTCWYLHVGFFFFFPDTHI